MAFTTQEHYDAEDYISTFNASSFERALVDLLAVADSENTKIIEKNWGDAIRRMGQIYKDYMIMRVHE